MVAARQGHVSIVRLLLEANAVTNDRNAEGKTALEIAKESGHQDVVNVMKEFLRQRRRR